jgi:hypothetical protein
MGSRRTATEGLARSRVSWLFFKARTTNIREGALPVRRSLWSYGHLLLRSAKLDPRRAAKAVQADRCRMVLRFEHDGLREQSGSCRTGTRSLPDGSAGAGFLSNQKTMSSAQQHTPFSVVSSFYAKPKETR